VGGVGGRVHGFGRCVGVARASRFLAVASTFTFLTVN
jgi:hypothetical protein